MPVENQTEKEKTPLEEPQDMGVTVKLGKSHYDALMKWSKERFGLANQAGMVRILIHDEWVRRNGNGGAQ